MTGIREDDKLLAQRYVDRELGDAERVAFESRLAADSELHAFVEELRDTDLWFAPGRAEPAPTPSEGFHARVLREARRLPRSEDVADAVSGGANVLSFEVACRRVMIAAALLMAFGLLVFGGLLHSADSGELEASPADIRQKMEELDATILEHRFGESK